MAIIDRFPGIRAVALLIAYDNGMINCGQTEEDWLADQDEVLGAEGMYEADLLALDAWCQSLTDDERIILAAGEDTEMDELHQRAPNPAHCGLFNDIFEHP